MDTSKSSALELLNKFLVYHHVSHEAMDEFFQYHPAKHGCWCPTLTESSKYKALKGHPSLSLLPNSSTKLDHNSLDKHCQIHSQCKTCIHNSMSLSVTDKSFKYYSVEFTADTTDPTNLLKTKIICNPGQYLPGENNWVDSLYYEEICQCDTEFVKGVIRNFVANRKPDLKFEGFCRDVNVSEYFKNLYESKFRELEDVAGKSQEVFNQSKVTTTEGSTTESSTAIPSETTSIETTTEIEASPTFDPNQTVEQLYNQLSQHHYDLKAAMVSVGV